MRILQVVISDLTRYAPSIVLSHEFLFIVDHWAHVYFCYRAIRQQSLNSLVKSRPYATDVLQTIEDMLDWGAEHKVSVLEVNRGPFT